MLSLEDVHTYYGESHALQGVQLHVAEGEIVSLLGRNGVGKTTTLRTIMGLTPPRRGRILFNGEPVQQASTHAIARRGIQLVPEDRGIFPRLTVRENLRMGSVQVSNPARAHRNAARVVEYFPVLQERMAQLGGSLSGGEQQQLSISRALLSGPDLLMLDEPCEGLAPRVVEILLDAIREIRADGTTVLLVEQNVHAALQLADYHYVMEKGRVVHRFTSEEIKGDPDLRHRYLGVSAQL